jgi:hypothetical protein
VVASPQSWVEAPTGVESGTYHRRSRSGAQCPPRQALEEELQRTKPPTDPDLDRAQELLEDFARFWQAEPEPAERRRLLTALFEHIWSRRRSHGSQPSS